MNETRPNPFETLEPPPDGLVRLRLRLERDRRRARARGACGAAAFVLLVGAAAWLALGPPPPPSAGAGNAAFRLARIGLGLKPPPAEPLTVRAEDRHRAAALRVPLSDDRVVFYLVAAVD